MTMSDEIEIKLPDLARVALEPGDCLLVRSPKKISQAAAAAIGANLRTQFPDNRILLMDEGLELSIYPTDRETELATHLDALADRLAADAENKTPATIGVILELRNEADGLRGH